MVERKRVSIGILLEFLLGGVVGWILVGYALYLYARSEVGIKGDSSRGLSTLAFGRRCWVEREGLEVSMSRFLFGEVEYFAIKKWEKGKDIDQEGCLKREEELGPVRTAEVERIKEFMQRIIDSWWMEDEHSVRQKRIYSEIKGAIEKGGAKIWAEERKGIRIIYCKLEVPDQDGKREKWIIAYIHL